MNRLFNVRPYEVSIVRRAANKRKFLLLKEEKMDPFKLEEVLKGAKIESEEALVKDLTEKGLTADEIEAAKVILKVQGHFKEKVSAELIAELLGYKPKVDDEASRKEIEKLQKENDDLKKDNKSVGERLDKAEEFIVKADARERDRTIIEKTKDLILPGIDKVKMDETFKKLSALDTEVAIGLADILDGASKMFQGSDWFKELGGSGDTGSDAEGKLVLLVQKAMKDDPKLLETAAWEKVSGENRDLYAQYRQENMGK